MNDFSMDTSDHDGSLSGARNDASKLSGSNVLGNEKELAYRTLGLCGPAATASDVRTAYRHLALMYHPDKVKGDAAMKKAAQDRFTGIGAAYWERVYDNSAQPRVLARCTATIPDSKGTPRIWRHSSQ